MPNSELSPSSRLVSAFTAIGWWSFALICWSALHSPKEWLDLSHFGSTKFYIQLVVLTGVAVPWIGLALALFFESKDGRGKS
jgi:hypothetical protein